MQTPDSELKRRQRLLAGGLAILAAITCVVVVILKGVVWLAALSIGSVVMIFLNLGVRILIDRHEERIAETAVRNLKENRQLEAKLAGLNEDQKDAMFRLVRKAVKEGDRGAFWRDIAINTFFFVLGIAFSNYIPH